MTKKEILDRANVYSPHLNNVLAAMQEYADQEVNTAKIKAQEMYMASVNQKEEQIKKMGEANKRLMNIKGNIETIFNKDIPAFQKYVQAKAALNPPSSPE